MLLIYLDEQSLSETERQGCEVESTELAQQIHFDGGSGRQPAAPNINGDQRPGAQR